MVFFGRMITIVKPFGERVSLFRNNETIAAVNRNGGPKTGPANPDA